MKEISIFNVGQQQLLLYILELILIVTFVCSLAYRKANIIEISDCDSES